MSALQGGLSQARGSMGSVSSCGPFSVPPAMWECCPGFSSAIVDMRKIAYKIITYNYPEKAKPFARRRRKAADLQFEDGRATTDYSLVARPFFVGSAKVRVRCSGHVWESRKEA